MITQKFFIKALRLWSNNYARDAVESAQSYISDAKHEFVEELKRQFSTLEALEPEINKFIEIGNCHRVHISRDERFAFEITENYC